MYQIISNSYIYVEISDENKQQIYWHRGFSELFISVFTII